MEEGSPGLHAVWMEQKQMEERSPDLHAVWMEQKQMEEGSRVSDPYPDPHGSALI